MEFNRVIREYELRAEDRAKKKQQQQCNISTNQYYILHDDTLEEYGRYKEPWSLDSAASGHYCGKNTKINNRKTTKNGIQVGVANNQSMKQIEKGELPFDQFPASANAVQVFPRMQSPLIGCGKLATNWCGIWFENENGSVISGKTKDKIRAIIATAGDDLLLAAPFDNQSITWKTKITVQRTNGGPADSQQCTPIKNKRSIKQLPPSSSQPSSKENLVSSNQSRRVSNLAGFNGAFRVYPRNYSTKCNEMTDGGK
jgi:hypothetical protein